MVVDSARRLPWPGGEHLALSGRPGGWIHGVSASVIDHPVGGGTLMGGKFSTLVGLGQDGDSIRQKPLRGGDILKGFSALPQGRGDLFCQRASTGGILIIVLSHILFKIDIVVGLLNCAHEHD